MRTWLESEDPAESIFEFELFAGDARLQELRAAELVVAKDYDPRGFCVVCILHKVSENRNPIKSLF